MAELLKMVSARCARICPIRQGPKYTPSAVQKLTHLSNTQAEKMLRGFLVQFLSRPGFKSSI
jgi:hypothetical protein